MEFLCPAIKDNVGVLDIFVITKIRFLKCSVKKELGGMSGKCLERHELTDGRNEL